MSHAVSYITIREQLDKSRAYDCNICPHSSPDLDLARAHYAVHVAGPKLLVAAKALIELRHQDNETGEWAALEAAVAKAEPNGT